MTDLRATLQSALGAAYVLERELGGGGMSRVFVATETAFNRRVAIKVVPVEGGPAAVARFRREIATAAQLQHPHLVPVLTAGEADGLPWFTMPYVAGESLRARLASQGALPLAEATRILRDVAQALAYAHAQGFVHRDIKPDNVLLADGSAVVTDFGVAKALSSATGAGDATTTPGATALTAAGMALGTPAYMAPEQVSADPAVDHRVDLYAWGCLAYEVLSGSAPFAHRTPSAIYAAHLTEAPAQLAVKRADVPPALAALVMRCLEKDPAQRPASARELVAALDGVVTPSAITAPAAPSSRAPMQRRLTIAAVLVLGSAGAWFFQSRGRTAGPSADAAALDHSVVVLPFENASRDTAQEYFADGLTDGLTGRLAQVGLRVTGRNTAYSFKGKHPTPQEAGKVAGVATVLTGTVRRLGDTVRVSAELARASDNAVLWTFSAQRAVAAVMTLQRELVDSIASRVAGTRRVAQTRENAVDPRAYDLVLRARFAGNQFTRAAIEQSLTLYDSALVLQPAMLEALLGKVESLGSLADGYEAPRKVLSSIDSLVQRAMAIDSTRPDVLGNAANLNANYRGRWPLARRYLSEARRRDPYNFWAMFTQYTIYIVNADIARADAMLDTMRFADPLSPIAAINRLMIHAASGDSARTRRAWEQMPASLRDVDYGDVTAAYLPLSRGQYDEVIRIARSREGQLGHPSALIGVALARQGRTAEAIAQLHAAERAWQRQYFPPELIAWIGAALGDTATMYRWLETGHHEESGWRFAPVLITDFDRHRSEPHLQQLLTRLGVKASPGTAATPPTR